LDAFDVLLNTKRSLSERDDILPFVRTHPHLVALLASYNAAAATCNQLGVEVGLYGEFVADAIAGDRSKKAYCFVEFEDATPRSLFAPRPRHGTDWATRFSRGFNQVVDWLWALETLERDGLSRPNAATIACVGQPWHTKVTTSTITSTGWCNR